MENKIEEMIVSLENGNLGIFKRDVAKLKKLDLVKLMLRIEAEPDTPYIQRVILNALGG